VCHWVARLERLRSLPGKEGTVPALYRIHLSAAERADLRARTRRGTASAREISRARALLLADRGLRDPEIATATGLSARTVQRIRRRACERGVAAALVDQPRPGGRPALDGKQTAYLVALSCADPPHGREHWTMQVLADRLVELEVVESISDETVRRTLKKTSSSPGSASSGAFRA
jgi:transposase